MSQKTITFDLTTASLNAAIDEIEKLADGIDKALVGTAKELTKQGVAAANIHLGITEETLGGKDYSIKVQSKFDEGERTGYVYADGDAAAYLEYGTGIVGMHAPHPGIVSGESTPPVLHYTTDAGEERVYTQYDTYEHGLKGWNYKVNGEWHHTAGFVGKAYMYGAYKDLCDIAPIHMREEMEKRGVMR